LRNRVFLSGSAVTGSRVLGCGSHRLHGPWVFEGSAGLLHTGNGSPETATGTAGHGGLNLRKVRVAQVLPDPTGLARGSLGSSTIGRKSAWAPPESHCLAEFQFWPPELRHLGRRVTASRPSSSLLCSVSLSLSLISLVSQSQSLSLSSLFLSSQAPSLFSGRRRTKEERKNNEEGRRNKTKKKREEQKILKG
jgi:hypothetical protein